MNKAFEILKEKDLVKNFSKGTSIEMLENMNKLNLIQRSNVSEERATMYWLSMNLRDDKSLKTFLKAYCTDGESVENFKFSTFFSELNKVCAMVDSKKVDYNSVSLKSDYAVIIYKILHERENGVTQESIKELIKKEIEQGTINVPTVKNYLDVAKAENVQVIRKFPNLQTEISHVDDLLGFEKNGFKKFTTENYEKAIYQIKNGFKVRVIFENYENLTRSSLKKLSKFSSFKTSAMQKVINKRGGKGYLSSPTREKGVKYFASNVRFFGKGRGMESRYLSLNGLAFYTLHDLNNRALRHKKSYIANEVKASIGRNATKDEIRVISNLASDLASRYMLYGIDFNNTNSEFDPNVLFDYRLESEFISKVSQLDSNNTWVLPIVQNLAGNMATEFYKNACIDASVVKSNLEKASKYLPEFDRSFEANNSIPGILFNSEASTYDLGMLGKKVKKADLSKNADKLKATTTFKKDDQPKDGESKKVEKVNPYDVTEGEKKVIDSIDKKIATKENKDTPKAEDNGAPKVEDKAQEEPKTNYFEHSNKIVVKIFGVDNVVNMYNMEDYCNNFIENVLKPGVKENIDFAKEMLERYNKTDESKSAKERLALAMGEETLNSFYTNYVDYTNKQVNATANYCQKYVEKVREQIYNKLQQRVNIYSTDEIDGAKAAKYLNLVKMVEKDKSLSTYPEFKKVFNPLIGVVVSASKAKVKNNKLDDEKVLNDSCRNKVNMELGDYLDKLIDELYQTMEKQNQLPSGQESGFPLLTGGKDGSKNSNKSGKDEARESETIIIGDEQPTGRKQLSSPKITLTKEYLNNKFDEWIKEAIEKDMDCARKNANPNSDEYRTLSVIYSDENIVKDISFDTISHKDTENGQKRAEFEAKFRDELSEVYTTMDHQNLDDNYIYDNIKDDYAKSAMHKIYVSATNKSLEHIDAQVTEQELEQIRYDFQIEVYDLIKSHSNEYVSENMIEREDMALDDMNKLGKKVRAIKKIVKQQYIVPIIKERIKHFEEVAQNKDIELKVISKNDDNYDDLVKARDSAKAYANYYYSLYNRFTGKNTKTYKGVTEAVLDFVVKSIDKDLQTIIDKLIKGEDDYLSCEPEELVSKYINEDVIKVLQERSAKVMKENQTPAINGCRTIGDSQIKVKKNKEDYGLLKAINNSKTSQDSSTGEDENVNKRKASTMNGEDEINDNKKPKELSMDVEGWTFN